MAILHCRKVIGAIVVLLVLVQLQSCRTSASVETVSVSLKNTETYQYATVGGDEDGATISTQASHYIVSEIRRNAATNWVATYVYQPVAGFVGSDYVEIDVLTRSDGASSPTSIKKVVLHLDVHN